MFKYAVLAVPLAFAAVPSSAQSVGADPQRIAALMQAGGHAADLTKDPTGDPAISSKAGPSQYWVLFYNCTDHQNCKTIEFHASYAMKDKPQLTLVNAWNAKSRFGRAYTDDVGDPVLQMDVDLDRGGMSPGLFNDNLDVWLSLLAKFEQHIGWR